MKRIILLFLLSYPILGFSQNDKPTTFKRFGVGIGYSTYSVMSDSIRPIELSLRYRINDKHALQLYTPVSINKVTINDAIVNTHKKKSYGIGVGYDYTFYNHSIIDFFTGINISYQWFESRRDWYSIYDRALDDGGYIEIEANYYYWDRVKGAVFTPNVGMRFTVSNRVIIEPRINVLLSVLSKESHSYYQERNTDQSGWATWESFYPDKRINDFEIQAGGSIHVYYCF